VSVGDDVGVAVGAGLEAAGGLVGATAGDPDDRDNQPATDTAKKTTTVTMTNAYTFRGRRRSKGGSGAGGRGGEGDGPTPNSSPQLPQKAWPAGFGASHQGQRGLLGPVIAFLS